MKRAILALQIAGTILFAGLFGYTYHAKETIREMARDTINERLRPKADVAVDLAEKGLRSPLAREFLSGDRISVLLEEIRSYRLNPGDYIQSLTSGDMGFRAQASPKAVTSLFTSLPGQRLDWKASIQRHFDHTFQRLMVDLRIFFGSNLVAFALAAFLLWRSAELGTGHRVVSATVTLATLFSAVMYIDQNWFFTILLNSYVGWSYPAGTALLCGWLLYEYYTLRPSTATV